MSPRKMSPLEESLKKHLKQFFAHRTIFDSNFVDGKKFKYTALNIGGIGIDRYGLYCVIIGREKAGNYTTLAFKSLSEVIDFLKDKYVESMEKLGFKLPKQEELKPDFLLIDSRTGITEMSGVCTSILPDKVVFLITDNRKISKALAKYSGEFKKQNG